MYKSVYLWHSSPDLLCCPLSPATCWLCLSPQLSQAGLHASHYFPESSFFPPLSHILFPVSARPPSAFFYWQGMLVRDSVYTEPHPLHRRASILLRQGENTSSDSSQVFAFKLLGTVGRSDLCSSGLQLLLGHPLPTV